MKKESKPIYIVCPRCELNYIIKKDKLCPVCKAEMGLIDPSILIPDDDEDIVEKLCPVCGNNYIHEDEERCFTCQKEQDEKDGIKTGDWEEPDHDAVIEDDEPEEEFGLIASELFGEDGFGEEEEEEEIVSEPVGEVDDFVYDLGDDDEEYDEEDDDEDDIEDFDDEE